MSDVSRRNLAKGTAWAIPTIAVGSAAPAMAASPCANIKRGSPLPASAFTATFMVTNQTFGGAANKVATFASGITVTPAAAQCLGATATSGPAISYTLNTTSSGTMTLTNNKTYTVSGGTGTAGTGSAGVLDTSCTTSEGATADACNTYTGNSLASSTGTSSSNPASAVLHFSVTVTGYGTTPLTLTVPSFTQSGTDWVGGNVTLS